MNLMLIIIHWLWKKEKTQIHFSYVQNIVKLDNIIISCSNDDIKFWNILK